MAAIPAVVSDGALVATGSETEDTVATVSDPRVLTFVVDLANLVAGDAVILRGYRKTRSGDTARVVYEEVFSGVQAQPIAIMVPMPSPHQAVFTITLVTATPRTFPWSVEAL